MALINFRLNKVEDTTPSGIDGDVTNWFSLTDGELWLKFDDLSIYEYTKQSHPFFPYRDRKQFSAYYIARFVEDFTEIISAISEPLPDFLHDCVADYNSLSAYQSWATSFLEKHYLKKKYVENDLEVLLSWIYKRALPSHHLLGGPTIWFFRIKDQMKIIWRADYKIAPDCYLWTQPLGEYVMDYDLFAREVQCFGRRFFWQMENRLNAFIAREHDSPALDISSARMLNIERQQMFENDVLQLFQSSSMITNWDVVHRRYKL
jgi:hypothetical protein